MFFAHTKQKKNHKASYHNLCSRFDISSILERIFDGCGIRFVESRAKKKRQSVPPVPTHLSTYEWRRHKENTPSWFVPSKKKGFFCLFCVWFLRFHTLSLNLLLLLVCSGGVCTFDFELGFITSELRWDGTPFDPHKPNVVHICTPYSVVKLPKLSSQEPYPLILSPKRSRAEFFQGRLMDLLMWGQ